MGVLNLTLLAKKGSEATQIVDLRPKKHHLVRTVDQLSPLDGDTFLRSIHRQDEVPPTSLKVLQKLSLGITEFELRVHVGIDDCCAQTEKGATVVLGRVSDPALFPP